MHPSKHQNTEDSACQDFEVLSKIYDETQKVWGDGNPSVIDIGKLLDKRENWIEILKNTENSRQNALSKKDRLDRSEFYNIKIKEILKRMDVIDKNIMAYFNVKKKDKVKEIAKITDIKNRRKKKPLIFDQNEDRRLVDIQQE